MCEGRGAREEATQQEETGEEASEKREEKDEEEREEVKEEESFEEPVPTGGPWRTRARRNSRLRRLQLPPRC